MSFVKYRVKEVATDFGISPKEVTEIIGKFMEKPKSYSQVLSDAELNVVFEHMTQKNQIILIRLLPLLRTSVDSTGKSIPPPIPFAA